MRLYLGEDAACNFAAAQAGSAPRDLILDWWGARDEGAGAAGAGMATGACNGEDSCTNRGPQESRSSESVKTESDDGATARAAKRHRDDELDAADVRVGSNGLKRPKSSLLQGEDGLGADARQEGGEWGEAEWAAFRRHLARETAAADATEASTRRSQSRCRSFQLKSFQLKR